MAYFHMNWPAQPVLKTLGGSGGGNCTLLLFIFSTFINE